VNDKNIKNKLCKKTYLGVDKEFLPASSPTISTPQPGSASSPAPHTIYEHGKPEDSPQRSTRKDATPPPVPETSKPITGSGHVGSGTRRQISGSGRMPAPPPPPPPGGRESLPPPPPTPAGSGHRETGSAQVHNDKIKSMFPPPPPIPPSLAISGTTSHAGQQFNLFKIFKFLCIYSSLFYNKMVNDKLAQNTLEEKRKKNAENVRDYCYMANGRMSPISNRNF